ncbi:hypothetical protein ASF15_14360 [Pseudomonas sp. Leaf83]|nr:hypothetical protein ASF15_14360 [Pseudomonas sp. Leaf83]
MTAIRRGERLLQVGVVLRFGVGALHRGKAFAHEHDIAGVTAIRRGARLLQGGALFCGLVWESRLGAKLSLALAR